MKWLPPPSVPMLRRAQSSETLCAQRSSERSISALNGCSPPRTFRPLGTSRRISASSAAKSISRSARRTVSIPQPISTPTMPGTTLSEIVIVVPMVQPLSGVDIRHNADPASGELLLIADRSDLLGGLLFQRRRVAQGRIVQPADLDHENLSFPMRRLCRLPLLQEYHNGSPIKRISSVSAGYFAAGYADNL